MNKIVTHSVHFWYLQLPHIEDHHTRGGDVEIEDGRNDLKSLFIFCLSTFLYFEQEIPQNTKNYQLEFPTGLTLKGTLAANSTLQTSSCDKHIKYDKCDKHITSSISLTRISQSTCHQVWNHFWNLIFLAKKGQFTGFWRIPPNWKWCHPRTGTTLTREKVSLQLKGTFRMEKWFRERKIMPSTEQVQP